MKKTTLILLSFLLSIMLYGNNDQWDNDFYLKNLSKSGRCLIDGKTEAECSDYSFDETSKKMFNQLMTEYGIATSLPFNEPAETLGRKGFESSIVYSMYSVGNTQVEDRNPWEGTFKGNEGSTKNLHIINMKVRKGLPGSFEVGGSFSYIFGSHMYMMGATGKFAVLEGINILPDLAVRVSYNMLFGSRQVIMNNKSIDLLISYDFGVVGMFALAPYAAYSKTFISAHSNLIANNTSVSPYKCEDDDKTKCSGEYYDYGDDDNDYDKNLDSFGAFNKSVNRFVLGVRVNNAAFVFTPEVIFTSEAPWGVNIKLGVDF